MLVSSVGKNKIKENFKNKQGKKKKQKKQRFKKKCYPSGLSWVRVEWR